MQDLVIQPQEGKKGRSFQAVCLATVTADALYPEGGGQTIRPIWSVFAGSEAELRPFMANLKLGRKAEKPSASWSRRGGDADRYEFLKSVGFHMAWQREAEGALCTIYHPDLFRLDPGMVDPTGVRFVMLVPNCWATAQKLESERIASYLKGLRYLKHAELVDLVPAAYLFAAYLDRRTRCPLIADGRFYLQLLCAALHQGLASRPGYDLKYNRSRDDWGHNPKHGFNQEGLDQVGITHAISFQSSHEDLEKFLAEQVELFFERSGDFVPLSHRIDLSSFLETSL